MLNPFVIELNNRGDVTSGALTIDIEGADASDFAFDLMDCATFSDGLPGATVCGVNVWMDATSGGSKSAFLVATAPDGGGTTRLVLRGVAYE